MDHYHTPVLAVECLEGLNIKPNGVYFDGTAGGGGHSFLIAQRLSAHGRLISSDRDAWAVEAAGERLKDYANATVLRGNFADAGEILDKIGVNLLDGALLDLGVSSRQLDEPSRGFSFMRDAPLDMRMDREAEITAYDVVNSYSEKALANIFTTYGEERFAGRIARAIVAARLEKPVKTTLELAGIVSESIPRKFHEPGQHPATRIFQAVRIEVNDELSILDGALRSIVKRLAHGGRLCVISFHSLEDRAVKQALKSMENPCQCPRDLPVCVCGKRPIIKIVTKKPVTAGNHETATNPRARSAKLRVAEKI